MSANNLNCYQIGACRRCFDIAKYRCLVCKSFYCSEFCQKSDWLVHKQECKDLIVKNHSFGQLPFYPRMTQDMGWIVLSKGYIAEGTTILIEDPLLKSDQAIDWLEPKLNNLTQGQPPQNQIELESFFESKRFGPEYPLYYVASHFNHHCQPNVHKYINNGQIKLITYRNIEPDQELNISYISEIFTTKENRNKLLGFECCCSVCQTPIRRKEKMKFLFEQKMGQLSPNTNDQIFEIEFQHYDLFLKMAHDIYSKSIYGKGEDLSGWIPDQITNYRFNPFTLIVKVYFFLKFLTYQNPEAVILAVNLKKELLQLYGLLEDQENNFFTKILNNY